MVEVWGDVVESAEVHCVVRGVRITDVVGVCKG